MKGKKIKTDWLGEVDVGMPYFAVMRFKMLSFVAARGVNDPC